MKAVNLLPPDLRGTPKKAAGKPAAEVPAGVGAYVVLGALAMAVVAFAVFVLAGNAVSDREAKLATVTQEAENATARANALKPYADFQTLAAQRATTVQSLADARFDWHKALDDLSRALPKQVALSEISGNVRPGVSSGGADNPLRSALGSPAISMKGCVDSHTSVARVMSRLRNIAGVTRVSLSSSDKGSMQQAGTNADAAAASAGGAYCGAGSPATFDLVVFFENATARTGAAPGMPGTDPAAAAGAAVTPPTTQAKNGVAAATTPPSAEAATGTTPAAGATPTTTTPTTTPTTGGGTK
jgi:Tfp pilus assembly protein PilN